jgi:hypothetical protein
MGIQLISSGNISDVSMSHHPTVPDVSASSNTEKSSRRTTEIKTYARPSQHRRTLARHGYQMKHWTMYAAENNDFSPKQKLGKRYTNSCSKILRVFPRLVSLLDPYVTGSNNS